ncbi:hypothetical protein [Mycolicibacterium brumae]|uniref:NAD-dependent epimerase/dehydratase domain-containing protein n=1 Tax=Mycolicibacterium brumae TaxID=85968 RepID=A0A2G5PEP0_9MYCO|nr:hypothetical protein [Mycolicibacterium brumae]MCV7192837.1 hypothetical protein [Mycolicibacterium brumae]PIB76493.1 hypothetical protein CQY22_005055 [Mycolicibacterium brumae]RWA23427.1 hypothetical protein MBRU_00995 [Mycolicibacterium brumae DSM 44177]UWW08643.1 hypothetical protein L2Z93_001706 [Mycolicibacterium brumae]
MRVLLTGVHGALGRAAARQLLAAGNEVSAVAPADQPRLDPRVWLTIAGPSGGALYALAEDADVIVHLSAVEPSAPESSGIGGVLAVTEAAGRSGSRLLVVTPLAGSPARHRHAEQLVTSCWAPSLLIRVAPLLGRDANWMVDRTVATLRRRAAVASMPALHTEDLLRFLTRAIGSHRTGTVDLAMPEPVDTAAARRWLTRAVLPPGAGWAEPGCALDLSALRDWEFACGWEPAAAVIDTARGLARRMGPAIRPLPPIAGEHLIDPAPPGRAGEFDTLIDHRFPEFAAASDGGPDVPAALPPLSLDLQAGALGCARAAMAAVMGLPGGLSAEWTQRGVAVVGQRFYVGTSAAEAVAALRARPAALAAMNTRLLAAARRFSADCDALALDAATDPFAEVPAAALTDAQLGVAINATADRIRQGWTTTGLGVLIEETLGPAERRRAPVRWLGELAAAAQRLDLRAPPQSVAPQTTTEPITARDPLTRRLLAAARSGRDRCWGITHAELARLATLVEEAGIRLAAVRSLAEPADVHFLTCDELTAAPLDTRLRVKRRQDDAQRLAAEPFPTHIDGRWNPLPQQDTG